MEIKIICHSCDGQKFIFEKTYPSRAPVRCECPECDGVGWVLADSYGFIEDQEIE